VECIVQERVVLKDIFKIFIVEMLVGSQVFTGLDCPTYQKNNKKSTDYMNIMSEEVWRELIRQKVGMPNSNLFGGSI
jgi:hypothetical protein